MKEDIYKILEIDKACSNSKNSENTTPQKTTGIWVYILTIAIIIRIIFKIISAFYN